MKYIKISNSDLNVSEIALGCMRISDLTVEQLEELIECAIKEGINLFDHADIYGGGKCEKLFGELLKKRPELREKMIIQTKCGIRKGFFDFSKEHIISSVNNSLENLNVDCIDILLLHRPDALMDPIEVAKAFNELHLQGKVKYFGVSNMNPYQVELLQRSLNNKLLFNQLQFNVVNATMIDAGLNVNMNNNEAVNRDASVLDYCRLNDITIQPWSIFQASWEKGTYLNHPEYKELNDKLCELGNKYNVSKAAIALSWILKHPAKMQPIAGTTNPKNLSDLCRASNIEITKKEWYDLYLSVGRLLP